MPLQRFPYPETFQMKTILMLTTTMMGEEIYQTVIQLNPFKVLGPYGMHASFYQKCWA